METRSQGTGRRRIGCPVCWRCGATPDGDTSVSPAWEVVDQDPRNDQEIVLFHLLHYAYILKFYF